MTSKTSKWRGREETRSYKRLQSFVFYETFPRGMDWSEYPPIAKIRQKTGFLNFAKECALGREPYVVAKEMEIPEDTAYIWIDRIIQMIKIRKAKYLNKKSPS